MRNIDHVHMWLLTFPGFTQCTDGKRVHKKIVSEKFNPESSTAADVNEANSTRKLNLKKKKSKSAY